MRYPHLALLAATLLIAAPSAADAGTKLTVTVRGSAGPLENAHVYVAEELAGRTGKDGTLAIDLPEGRYPVQVQKPGMAPWKGHALVGSAAGKLAVPLKPRLFRLTLKKGDGPDMRVKVAGPSGAKTVQTSGPGQQLDLAPGKYKLAADADGYVPFETQILVTRSMNMTLPALVPLEGREPRDWRHTLAMVGFGMGIAGLLVSVGLMLMVVNRKQGRSV